MVSGEEDVEGEEDSMVDANAGSVVVEDSSRASTSFSTVKARAPTSPADRSAAEEVMTGAPSVGVLAVPQGNVTPALTASRAAATHRSIGDKGSSVGNGPQKT